MPMVVRPRHDVARRDIATLIIEIYQRDDDLGRGIAFSVYESGVEQRRYDLFPRAAHLHRRSDPSQPRRYFPRGKTVLEYGELAIKDLRKWRPAVTDEVAAWIRDQIAKRYRNTAT